MNTWPAGAPANTPPLPRGRAAANRGGSRHRPHRHSRSIATRRRRQRLLAYAFARRRHDHPPDHPLCPRCPRAGRPTTGIRAAAKCRRRRNRRPTADIDVQGARRPDHPVRRRQRRARRAVRPGQRFLLLHGPQRRGRDPRDGTARQAHLLVSAAEDAARRDDGGPQPSRRPEGGGEGRPVRHSSRVVFDEFLARTMGEAPTPTFRVRLSPRDTLDNARSETALFAGRYARTPYKRQAADRSIPDREDPRSVPAGHAGRHHGPRERHAGDQVTGRDRNPAAQRPRERGSGQTGDARHRAGRVSKNTRGKRRPCRWWCRAAVSVPRHADRRVGTEHVHPALQREQPEESSRATSC